MTVRFATWNEVTDGASDRVCVVSGARSRRSPTIITRALWRSCLRGSDAQAGWWAPWTKSSTYSPLGCLVAAMRRFHALIVAIEITSAASCGSL